MTGVAQGARIATYTAPLGRLAEMPPGEFVDIKLDGEDYEATVVERVRLRPARRPDVRLWDALDDIIEFEDWRVSIESLLQFLEQLGHGVEIAEEDVPDVLGPLLAQAAELKLVHENARRQVIERMSLRDQPILDRYQGEVFRMPLDNRLVLLGPPGSGKTTTLIRRLAHKLRPDDLEEGDRALLAAAGYSNPVSFAEKWAMFSPTELLTRYLRDAFNREQVPAGNRNLKTWERERLDLGRGALGILRTAESSGFVLSQSLSVFMDETGAGVLAAWEEFDGFHEEAVLRRCTDAFKAARDSGDEDLRKALSKFFRTRVSAASLTFGDIVSLLERGSDFQPESKRLGELIDRKAQLACNRLLKAHGSLLGEINTALPEIMADTPAPDTDAEEDFDEELVDSSGHATTIRETSPPSPAVLLLTGIRALARATAQGRSSVGGRSGRVVALLGHRKPPKDELQDLGDLIVVRGHLRTLIQAPRHFVMGARTSYSQYRRTAVKQGRIFKDEAKSAVSERRISGAEADLLILTMLRNARRLVRKGASTAVALPAWLEVIRDHQLGQVFVDEATDFSPVQLACMIELCDQGLKSWFACGDILQRITSHGIRDIDEFDRIGKIAGHPLQVRKIDIAYRQSLRLRNLLVALALSDGVDAEMKAPEYADVGDVWPILAENISGMALAQWLARSIREVEIETGIGRLPSVAVFVDSEEQVEELVVAVRPHLAEHNIPIIGCTGGRDVGDASEVRVFDVRHVKGLEFEAVFFVGIDRLAKRYPDLFKRFLYVGASRAATYLGVTSEGQLPAAMDDVRPHFSRCWRGTDDQA